MNLSQRIDLLIQLGNYMAANEQAWQEAQYMAERKNGWFTQPFITLAASNIVNEFLDEAKLNDFAAKYQLANTSTDKIVGIIMAGNIPLVGFHDFLCGFLSGHTLHIKLSEKDDVLLKHLVAKLVEWQPELAEKIMFTEMLKGCHAYIATGSNNSSRYFEVYFGKYPNIIRKNRTSVAILDGTETAEELEKLADDVHLYFGLGCRNVTKIYVPEAYDFLPLLTAFRKYNYMADHHKYKNNYDYNLAIHILNKVYYMTNDSILLIEDERLFSPISQLHYSFYKDKNFTTALGQSDEVQCIIGNGFLPFGAAQQPSISQFADGVDTMLFLQSL